MLFPPLHPPVHWAPYLEHHCPVLCLAGAFSPFSVLSLTHFPFALRIHTTPRQLAYRRPNLTCKVYYEISRFYYYCHISLAY